jgi:hypothetical protein
LKTDSHGKKEALGYTLKSLKYLIAHDVFSMRNLQQSELNPEINTFRKIHNTVFITDSYHHSVPFGTFPLILHPSDYPTFPALKDRY